MSKQTQTKDLHRVIRVGHVIEHGLAGLERLADNPASQDALAALLELDRSIKVMQRLQKELAGALQAHLEKGGRVEKGALLANLVTTEKRSPAWKDEAVKLASTLARRQRKKFDLDKFVAAVLKRTPTSTCSKVKITPAE